MHCFMCGQPADLSGHRLKQANVTGRAYCSRQCSRAYQSLKSSEAMSRTNKRDASARMMARNPMRKPEARAKMIATLKAAGHKPAIRGGNGKAPTAAELILETLFCDMGFVMQPAIKTKRAKEGFPTCYKPDLGNWKLKIAIEADGASHESLDRRAQDAKKDAFLRSIGWRVYRFTNAQITLTPRIVARTILEAVAEVTLCN